MINEVKTLRERKNLTQSELAEKAGLSLRTVQRIEAGNIPKGFTLKALARSLEIDPEQLFKKEVSAINTDRAKIINYSALGGLIFPYGNIIFPAILTYQTKDLQNKNIGKNIVAQQIILSVALSFFLIISPFLQHQFSVSFPLFLVPLVLFIAVKTVVVIRNGISLNQNNTLAIKLKTNFL